MSTPIAKARNLGPASAQMLEAQGIRTLDDLMIKGAVNAYLAILASGGQPSLNLLWALIGAVEDRDWREIDQGRKDEFIRMLKGVGG